MLVIRNVSISSSSWGSDGALLSSYYDTSQQSASGSSSSVAGGGGVCLGFVNFGGSASHSQTQAGGQPSSWSAKDKHGYFGTTFDGTTLTIPGAQIAASSATSFPQRLRWRTRCSMAQPRARRRRNRQVRRPQRLPPPRAPYRLSPELPAQRLRPTPSTNGNPTPVPIFRPVMWHTLAPIRETIVPTPVLERPFPLRAIRPQAMAMRSDVAAATFAPGESIAPAALANRFSIRGFALAARQAAASAEPQTVSAAAPVVSFDYCLVKLQRRWLSQALLGLPGWYMNGYGSGELATGSDSTPSAPFDAIPSAFIAIRNLKIQAQWSAQDSQAMQASAGIGPFSIAGQTFDAASGTLACAGMQIIGWVCERQPLIPPQGDPALTSVSSNAAGTTGTTPAPPPSTTTSAAASTPAPASASPSPSATAAAAP
jgi:hypothetical protein